MTDEELEALDGKHASEEELNALIAFVGALHPDLLSIYKRYAICGVEMEMDEARDLSGLGVELEWMTPGQALEEARDFYPGIAATNMGFVPFGTCLSGSGDPYFVETESGKVVRVPHDAADADADVLDVAMIEVISPSIRDFLRVVAFAG